METQKQPTEFFNVQQAIDLISEKYGRTFRRLLFVISSQITDGSIVEFYDEEMRVTVASCRLRYRNKLCIDKQTGTLTSIVELSDMSFGSASVDLNSINAK